MNSLTHSLNHDGHEVNNDGLHIAEYCSVCIQEASLYPIILASDSNRFGFPEPGDVPTHLQDACKIQERIRKFTADRKAQVHKTALTFVEVQEEILQIQYSKKRTKYWFVTINPKASVTVEELHNTIVEMLDRPQVVDCLWTYEIRKAPKEGLHAHVCFETSEVMDSNFVNRKVKSLFVPKLCGTPKHVDVKWPDSQQEYEKCKQYAKKTTVSKGKKDANSATVKWRKDQKIHDFYGEDHLLVWSSLPQLTTPVVDNVDT